MRASPERTSWKPPSDALPLTPLAWSAARAGEPGYTEDAARSPMRFVHHGRREKHVRDDRVLARGLRPRSAKLVGDAPIAAGVFVSDPFGVAARLVR
ncbi:MAG: hypothetical protein CMN31_25330 [Sandaracinus sp.]|nr:hypothetical protein [Sandaracinus sp.]MBJ74613.1 hypothetical protein [Sandaracinus sp.]